MTIAIGSIGVALGEGMAVARALNSLAQQPDAAGTITRTLFVGVAMIESTAIYCFVVSMIPRSGITWCASARTSDLWSHRSHKQPSVDPSAAGKPVEKVRQTHGPFGQ
jgi:ATP synthase F0 subunit c